MKRALILAAVLFVGLAASQALAAPGDWYILPIDHLNGSGWVSCEGDGYNGSDAYMASGSDGSRRIYWSLSNVLETSPGAEALDGMKLYSISFFVPYCPNNGAWQPIESQINGVDGETYPIEPIIPWAGAYGTNHQYIGTEYAPGDVGTWKSAGPGPHTPEYPYGYDAGPNGDQMWLKSVSWLYAKWDYGWSISRCWSALRITECPEPSSLLALFAGLPALALLRRKH